MYLFNPRLRHLTAALIQCLYQGARSAVFQTLNFPWNRCEKHRQHSDAGFCFTCSSLLWHWCSSSFLLTWTLQIPVTSLPDTTFHLGMPSDGNCTELPQKAGHQFFTPPNCSPKFRMSNMALALFYLMLYFSLLFHLYVYIMSWQMQVELFQDK